MIARSRNFSVSVTFSASVSTLPLIVLHLISSLCSSDASSLCLATRYLTSSYVAPSRCALNKNGRHSVEPCLSVSCMPVSNMFAPPLPVTVRDVVVGGIIFARLSMANVS